MTDSSPPLATSQRVLAIPAFRQFILARALSSIAFQVSAVAIGWLIYDKTRNPFDLGLVGLFQFLPMLLLTLPAGHLADQVDRRRVNAVNALFIGTSNQLGEFRAGVMAGFVGPVAAVAFGGFGTLAVVALWTVMFPALRRVKTLSG